MSFCMAPGISRLARQALPWSGRSQRRSWLSARPVADGTGFRPSAIQSTGRVLRAQRGVELLPGCSSRRARGSGLLSDSRTFCSPWFQFLKVIFCGRPTASCLPPPSSLSPRASCSPPSVLLLVRGLPCGRSQLCHPGLAGSRCPPTALRNLAPGRRRPPPPSTHLEIPLWPVVNPPPTFPTSSWTSFIGKRVARLR